MLHNEELKPLMETKTNVYGSDGKKIGTLGQIYLDDETNEPHFATVNTGLFGSAENFVPLSDAEISNGQLYVRFTKRIVTHAPNIDPMGHLSPEDEDRLFAYYSQAGLGIDQSSPESVPPIKKEAGPVGLVQGTPLAVEENLHTLGNASARPRIRKYVVAENQPGTLPPMEEEDSTHETEARGKTDDGPMVEGHRIATEEVPETRRQGRAKPTDP